MSCVTSCLGAFSLRISRLPKAKWKAEIDRLPEACPHGCRVHCRQVCGDYARMQWRMDKARHMPKPKPRASNGRDRAPGQKMVLLTADAREAIPAMCSRRSGRP